MQALRTLTETTSTRLGTWPTVTMLAVATTLWLLLFDVHDAMVGGGRAALSLQKAFTVEAFAEVVAPMGDSVEMFKLGLIALDFVFPVMYAALIVGAWRLVRKGAGPWWVGALPWLAAGADWIENTLHLTALKDVHVGAEAVNAPALLVIGGSVFASIKWVLLLAALVGTSIRAVDAFRTRSERDRRVLVIAGGSLLFAIAIIAGLGTA